LLRRRIAPNDSDHACLLLGAGAAAARGSAPPGPPTVPPRSGYGRPARVGRPAAPDRGTAATGPTRPLTAGCSRASWEAAGPAWCAAPAAPAPPDGGSARA